MTDVIDFPEVEDLLRQMLAADDRRVVTFLPDETDTLVKSGIAVVLVERIGGTDDGVTDRAEVLVTVWGRTRPEAVGTARSIGRTVASFESGGAVGDLWVDHTRTTSSATQIVLDDPDERRVHASYRIDTRRQSVPG